MEKPKFPEGASAWWNKPRSEMTPEQLEARRKYDRELRAFHRQDPKKAERDKKAYKKHVKKNKKKVYTRNAQWRRDNWDAVYKKRRERLKFRIRGALQTRIWNALKGGVKAAKTMELIGCSIEDLKTHLESQFQKGMNWDNYGEWHIDHIKPCASFDLSKEEQQKECFHYTNLQPLWAEENLKKGASSD